MTFACAPLLNRQSLENYLPLITDPAFAERRDQLQAMVLDQSILTPPAQSASHLD
jgi:hypothetical protein